MRYHVAPPDSLAAAKAQQLEFQRFLTLAQVSEKKQATNRRRRIAFPRSIIRAASFHFLRVSYRAITRARALSNCVFARRFSTGTQEN